MPDESDDKSIKRSVSFPPQLLEEAQARADAAHGGNLSRYVQHLIKADVRGETGGDALQSGAQAFVKFRELQPGNYAERLQRAVADGRPFAEIVDNLTGGDPLLMVLLRRAYDFLAGRAANTTPPVMEALLEIRDLLSAGAALPAGVLGEKPPQPYHAPSSPSAAVIGQALHKEAPAAKSAGVASPRRKRAKRQEKSPRGA